MDTLGYAPNGSESAPRSRLVRFLADHNPFYLLSAMCMLGGCLALTNSLSFSPIRAGRVLGLIGTLAAYEGILLCLGLYLLVRRRLARDGLMLLVLVALFLSDAAFLNVEIFAIDLHAGVVVNVGLFALAAVKLYVVFRALGLPRGGTFVYILAELAVLFATPGVFAWVSQGRRDGHLPPDVAYAAWWAAGLLPVLYVALVRPDGSSRLAPFAGHARPDASPLPARPRLFLARTFLVLPFLSALLHLAMMHWVYDARLYAAYVAPVLLGLTAVLARLAPLPLLLSLRDARLLRAALPSLAVLCSLSYPNSLTRSFGDLGRLELNPPLLTTGAAYLAYVHLYFAAHALWAVATAAAVGLLAAFGPTARQVASAVEMSWATTVSLVGRLVPKSAAAWGVIAVAAAFAFLGIGAAFSLKKPTEAPVPVGEAEAPAAEG